jgi:hypothetical protein
MQEVLELCGTDPLLSQRQAIHMVQTDMVSHRLFVSATAKRRLYSYWNLLEFEIARVLFVGFGVPPASVKEIIRRLHNGGFFLAPEQVVCIERDKKRFDNAAEFREHLNQTYKIDLLQYASPYNLDQRGHETVRTPRSARQHKIEIRQIANKALRLARKTPRPWPLYVLVFRDREGWEFDTGPLPGGRYLETEGDVPELKVDEESYERFAELVSAHPSAISLNLHKLEEDVRQRFRRKHGETESDAEDRRLT